MVSVPCIIIWDVRCCLLSPAAAACLQLGRPGCSGILDETLDLLATLSWPEGTQGRSAGSSGGTSPMHQQVCGLNTSRQQVRPSNGLPV